MSATKPETTSDVPSVNDAIDSIDRARNLVELMFLAGEGLSTRETKNAITAGCDVIEDALKEAVEMLHAIKAGRAAA